MQCIVLFAVLSVALQIRDWNGLTRDDRVQWLNSFFPHSIDCHERCASCKCNTKPMVANASVKRSRWPFDWLFETTWKRCISVSLFHCTIWKEFTVLHKQKEQWDLLRLKDPKCAWHDSFIAGLPLVWQQTYHSVRSARTGGVMLQRENWKRTIMYTFYQQHDPLLHIAAK